MAFDGHQGDSADSEEPTHTPATFLSQQDTDPAVVIEAHNEKTDSTTKLHTTLQTLDHRSREILAERWLSDKNPLCTNWLINTVCLQSVFAS